MNIFTQFLDRMFLLWISNSCRKIKSFQYFFVEIMDFNPLCDVIYPDFVRKIFRILKFLKTGNIGINFRSFSENRISNAILVEEEYVFKRNDRHTDILIILIYKDMRRPMMTS